MRWKAVILIIAVLSGILLPPALPLMTAAGMQPAIGSLDVCHSSVPAVASGGEMPCVNVCADLPAPFYRPLFTEPPQQALTHFLLSTQNERPPKA